MTEQEPAILGGVRATRVVLTIPNVGPWWADVDLETDAVPTDGVLRLGDSAWHGTIDTAHAGSFGLQRKVRIVAGAGSWATKLTPKHYHSDSGVAALGVAQDAARECGEALGRFDPSAPLLAADYARGSFRASRVLEAAAGEVPWWVDAAGITHVAARPEVDVSVDAYEVLQYDPRQGIATLAVDDISAIGIGARLTERLVSPVIVRELQITIDSAAIRVTAWCADPAEASKASRLTRVLQAIIDKSTDSKLHGIYHYRVVRMNGDRVDLQAVSPGVPDMVPVSMAPGVSGAHAKLAGGSDAYVAFVEGDPQKPVIVSFGGAGTPAHVPDTLTLCDGTLPAARQGDLVQCGGTGTTVTFAPVTPAVGPMLPGVPYLISFSPIPPVPGLASPLYGAISIGSPRVRIG